MRRLLAVIRRGEPLSALVSISYPLIHPQITALCKKLVLGGAEDYSTRRSCDGAMRGGEGESTNAPEEPNRRVRMVEHMGTERGVWHKSKPNYTDDTRSWGSLPPPSYYPLPCSLPCLLCLGIRVGDRGRYDLGYASGCFWG